MLPVLVRNLPLGNQILCLLVIILERTVHLTMQNAKINSQINRLCLFPFQIGIRQFRVSHLELSCLRIQRQDFRNQIRTHVLHHVSLITVSGRQRQVIQQILPLQPMFIRHVPPGTDRPHRQIFLFLVLSETVGTITSHGEIQGIAIIIHIRTRNIVRQRVIQRFRQRGNRACIPVQRVIDIRTRSRSQRYIHE